MSGGPDSLALLVLATTAECAVTAVHVDHGLRPGSAAEAQVVADAAARFGAAYSGVIADVVPGPNLEARAREARYAVLPPDVLTGHTLDDQAETVLLNLMRGSGLAGIAGMRTENRPLLELRRTETHALCRAEGLEPVVDPTNTDPRFRRNRVRAELLPLLADIADRDVAAVLARNAALARDAVDHLDGLATEIDPTDCAELRATDAALARLAIRRWLVAETHGDHPPDAAAVDRVLEVARGSNVATEIAGGVRVSRSGGRLFVHRRPR